MEIDWTVFPVFREDLSIRTDPRFEFLCKHCGGHKVFVGQDEFGVAIDLPTCTTCGSVDAEYVSDEPEWRTGGDTEGPDPTRVGAPENLDHFSGVWNMGTIIQHAGFGSKNFSKVNTLKRRQTHCNANHKDRSLFHAYVGMDRVGKEVLGLTDNVMYLAKTKYRKFNENVLTRGAVRTGVKANCIFQACRELGLARTKQEIAEAFGIPPRDISRTFEIYQEQVPETDVHVITPADLVPRIFNSITHVPELERGRVKAQIIKACKSLDECVELMGRTPKAIVCAVAFHMLSKLGHPISKAEVCKLCDVSGPTLAKIDSIVKGLIN
jgi:transcription initiation factor TFIIIB Brf1 subunit/transcription initiation factor TFIIB